MPGCWLLAGVWGVMLRDNRKREIEGDDGVGLWLEVLLSSLLKARREEARGDGVGERGVMCMK